MDEGSLVVRQDLDANRCAPYILVVKIDLPGWVRHHAEAHDDAECAEYMQMTPAERWQRFVAVTRLSQALLSANEHRDQVVEMRDERDAESMALWHGLMARRG